MQTVWKKTCLQWMKIKPQTRPVNKQIKIFKISINCKFQNWFFKKTIVSLKFKSFFLSKLKQLGTIIRFRCANPGESHFTVWDSAAHRPHRPPTVSVPPHFISSLTFHQRDEGGDVLDGEEGGGEFSEERFQHHCRFPVTHFVPLELVSIEPGIQFFTVLLQSQGADQSLRVPNARSSVPTIMTQAVLWQVDG